MTSWVERWIEQTEDTVRIYAEHGKYWTVFDELFSMRGGMESRPALVANTESDPTITEIKRFRFGPRADRDAAVQRIVRSSLTREGLRILRRMATRIARQKVMLVDRYVDPKPTRADFEAFRKFLNQCRAGRASHETEVGYEDDASVRA